MVYEKASPRRHERWYHTDSSVPQTFRDIQVYLQKLQTASFRLALLPETDHDTATKGREEVPPDGPGGSVFDSWAFNDSYQAFLSCFSL